MNESRRNCLKQMLLGSASLLAAGGSVTGEAESQSASSSPIVARFDATRNQRMAWWREARFGMFMHFGLYSVPSRGEWLMAIEDIPALEYQKFADDFHPAAGCTRGWARAARDAGMKYMVLTTKHHEGFCLFDTKLTDYSATKLGPKRDIIAEYVESVRAEGLKVGFYFSLMDWHHPDGMRCADDESARRRFVDFVHGQVRELMTNYGKIDILWYDMAFPLDAKGFESERLNNMVLDLQPTIVINNRSGIPGDFDTPEGNTSPTKRDWESCMTLNDNWGYNHMDHNWKSASAVVSNLVKCSMFGGNYLLDVGPMPEGPLPDECLKRLHEVGEWMQRYGDSIYGSRRSTVGYSSFGQFTQRGNTIYLHVDYWLGTELVLAGVAARVKTARFLDGGKPVRFEQDGEWIRLKDLPAAPPYQLGPVIAVEFAELPVQESKAARIVYKCIPDLKPPEATV